MPAEWDEHEATWVAWPSAADLWLDQLEPARAAFIELCAAIAEGETVEVLAHDETQGALARHALGHLRSRFHRIPFGDIWLRDTAPIWLVDEVGRRATVRFAFNGWGMKYVLEHDDRVAERIAEIAGVRSFVFPWVLEGGSIDVDGEGTLLTTRQCLLNPNRNGAMSQRDVEAGLCDAFGVERVLWLGDGLANDHTDGHVDTIARFVRPGVVLAMEPRAADDPNRDALEAILRDLTSMTDARGRRLEVVRIPSPGRVLDAEGRVMPASYANFYVGNRAVVVPTYGAPWDHEVVMEISGLFPERRAVGLDARALLTGGGALHCITQQVVAGGGA
jgi:agmatine deiminase